MKNIRLHIELPGITSEAYARAIAAAAASLQADGVTPWDGASGLFAIEGDDIAGTSIATEKDASDMGAWCRADDAAIDACSDCWTVRPYRVLEMHYDE